MLSIVLLTPLIAGSAIPPCLIATFKVFSKFGALKERSYYETIWLQILKILREEKNAVRELRRCDRGATCFSAELCTLAKIRFTIFTPRLAIFSLASTLNWQVFRGDA